MSAQGDGALRYFPVSFFTVVMGLAGLTLSLFAAAHALGGNDIFARVSYWITILCYIVISITYMVKLIRYPAAVRAEWHQPDRIPLFPAISFSLLLIAIATLEFSRPAAHLIWLAGVVAQAALTFGVISTWLGQRAFEHPTLSPAWFIPVVGNMLVPIAGVPLGYAELSWLFYSMGLMFWAILLVLVVNRLIFHEPLPSHLRPTLVIMIAPPAIGFLGYLQLSGGVDAGAHILLDLGYTFALLVLIQIPKLLTLPFVMSFWALSFPVASLAVASFRYAATIHSRTHLFIGLALLALLVAVVMVLILRTIRAMWGGDIWAPR